MQKRLLNEPSAWSLVSSSNDDDDEHPHDLNELDVNDLLESFEEHCCTFVQNAYLYVLMITIIV